MLPVCVEVLVEVVELVSEHVQRLQELAECEVTPRHAFLELPNCLFDHLAHLANVELRDLQSFIHVLEFPLDDLQTHEHPSEQLVAFFGTLKNELVDLEVL